jgi:glucose/mannose-6-phosphate isomerase
MNLDDVTVFAEIDRQGMYAHILGLPEQLRQAWRLGQQLELPGWTGIQQVLIAGMGGSAIGAELLAAWAAPTCKTPIHILRDYDLPAWANGSHTLVIGSSHSGNTEETLSAFKQALQRGCRCLALSTGGALEQTAGGAAVPAWIFEHHGQPRTAVGYSFGLLLALFARLHLVEDPQDELVSAVESMLHQQESLRAEMPAARNPAKRMAGQLMGRFAVVLGSGVLAPVARRWKGQISEIAKAWAQFEFLPEADHNSVAGVLEPQDHLSNLMVLFLRGAADHPRNRLRSDLTRKVLMLEGLNTDFIDAQGETPLANLWTCLHMGDFVAYYLAMAYGVDPTPVQAIEALKREMKAAG